MNTYALAKLISSVASVDGRKRLQKVVCLLQYAGCDLGARFRLHYYGPYSDDVAEATNFLTQAGVLDEEEHSQPLGSRYSYQVSGKGKELLEQFRDTADARKAELLLPDYFALFSHLNQADLWLLELASTMAFYRKDVGKDWSAARTATSEFKNVDPRSDVLAQAEELAATVLADGSHRERG